MTETIGRRSLLQAISLLPFLGNSSEEDVVINSSVNGGALKGNILVDNDSTVIENTTVHGSLNLLGKKGCVIRNTTIVSTSNGKDCIRSGGNGTEPQGTLIENVTCMGRNGHGVVFTSGGENIVRGLKAVNCSHGLVFRCSDSMATDVYAENCQFSGITIKAVQGAGNAMWNVINGFNLSGCDLILEAHDDHFQTNNVVSNGTMKSGRIVVKSVGTGECLNSVISNVIIDRSQFSGVEVLRNVRNTILSGILVRFAGSYSFRTDTNGGAALIGCQSLLPRVGAISGTFSREDVI